MNWRQYDHHGSHVIDKQACRWNHFLNRGRKVSESEAICGRQKPRDTHADEQTEPFPVHGEEGKRVGGNMAARCHVIHQQTSRRNHFLNRGRKVRESAAIWPPDASGKNTSRRADGTIS